MGNKDSRTQQEGEPNAHLNSVVEYSQIATDENYSHDEKEGVELNTSDLPRNAFVDALTEYLSPTTDNILSGYADILVYKHVRFEFKNKRINGNDSGVVLWMQVPSNKNIQSSETSGLVKNINDMKSATKYRASQVYVLGAQFFGDAPTVKKMLYEYCTGDGRLVSDYDKKFEYKVEEEKSVAKRLYVEQGCGHGIHFFTDLKSAFNYNGGVNPKRFPIITRVMKNPQEMVIALPNDFAGSNDMVFYDEIAHRPTAFQQRISGGSGSGSRISATHSFKQWVLNFTKKPSAPSAPPAIECS